MLWSILSGCGVSTFAKLLNVFKQFAIPALKGLTFLPAHEICFFQPH